mmetsp:Transcript_54162/g.160715  ORF Transcript_54162/g.160715 Transcript_54162/m.160715 type:complete len:258 (-) Transcript_54162:642-1415(-)
MRAENNTRESASLVRGRAMSRSGHVSHMRVGAADGMSRRRSRPRAAGVRAQRSCFRPSFRPETCVGSLLHVHRRLCRSRRLRRGLLLLLLLLRRNLHRHLRHGGRLSRRLGCSGRLLRHLHHRRRLRLRRTGGAHHTHVWVGGAVANPRGSHQSEVQVGRRNLRRRLHRNLRRRLRRNLRRRLGRSGCRLLRHTCRRLGCRRLRRLGRSGVRLSLRLRHGGRARHRPQRCCRAQDCPRCRLLRHHAQGGRCLRRLHL